jgi:hypothetical protein
VTGFWRPRRQAGTADAVMGRHNGPLIMAPAHDDHDPELLEQLAHLEELERRHGSQYQQVDDPIGGEAEGAALPLPEEAWPAIIPEVPVVAGDSLAPVLQWLEIARSVLSARASRNRDELQRLSSQWVHLSRNLARFRAEEVAALVEAQARVRERIAGDETACHLIRLVSAHLEGWERAPDAVAPGDAGGADRELMRRLLDGAAEDRARSAHALLEGLLERLAGLALDMEVVQREVDHEPHRAAETVRALQDRLTGVVEDLRGLPGTAVVAPLDGEPLHATLRRCLERYQPGVAPDLAWTGGEPADPEVRAAVLWVVQEFLAGSTAAGGRAPRVSLANGGDEVVLRLTAEVPGGADGAAEPGWVLRSRTRAAVAGGTLAAVPQDGGDAGYAWADLEVRFPVRPLSEG